MNMIKTRNRIILVSFVKKEENPANPVKKKSSCSLILKKEKNPVNHVNPV